MLVFLFVFLSNTYLIWSFRQVQTCTRIGTFLLQVRVTYRFAGLGRFPSAHHRSSRCSNTTSWNTRKGDSLPWPRKVSDTWIAVQLLSQSDESEAHILSTTWLCAVVLDYVSLTGICEERRRATWHMDIYVSHTCTLPGSSGRFGDMVLMTIRRMCLISCYAAHSIHLLSYPCGLTAVVHVGEL